MEMQQVRYFLATASELNFTRAAERCNVTQPSLTRAIMHLEDELGGIQSHDIDVDQGYELTSEHDLITLLEADLGIAFAPRSTSCPETLKLLPVKGLELRRTIYLYGVAGRQRNAAASAVLKMLRAADWNQI